MDYDELLNRARSKLPEDIKTKERFEVPNVKGHIQGNKTMISNFHQIASQLGRDEDHVLKYILKELATPGELTKNMLIFGSKVPASRINEKIQLYTEKFVICKECGRPDTKLSKQDRLQLLKCSACGAKYPVSG